MQLEIKGYTMPRGGKREGAGRPKIERARKTLSCRVKPETLDFLEEEKERTQKSLGEIVDEAVEEYKKIR